MIFGKKRKGDPDSVEDRYRAVVRLVLRRGFEPQGLTLIEVDGGFIVRGLRAIHRGLAPASETVALEELLVELEHLN